MGGMKVNERQKLNMFEMKCLRSMTGVSRLDRVRNEVVRVRTGVRRELAARVDMNVLRWFSHVERMDNERLLKKVMNVKVDGRSARGRPRFGWMDGVKRALNDRRMDVREASEHARNRNEWNGMECVIWAKGPVLGPGRSFSADRRRREKICKIEREESIHQN